MGSRFFPLFSFFQSPPRKALVGVEGIPEDVEAMPRECICQDIRLGADVEGDQAAVVLIAKGHDGAQQGVERFRGGAPLAEALHKNLVV